MFKKDFVKSYYKDLLQFGHNQNFNNTEINNKIKEYENYNPFTKTIVKGKLSFTEFFEIEVKNTTKQSTKHTNQYVLNSLNQFRKNIYFEDLDRNLMLLYKGFLTEKRKDKPIKNSTIKKYFQVIKTTCNKAKEDGYKFDDNTFNIKIGNDERINNKVLTKEDIEKLNNIHIGQRYFNERNVFLFSLYGQGLRVSDALFIKVENFKQSHLEIGMTKTKKNIQILYSDKLMDVLLDILNIPNPVERFKVENAKIYVRQQTDETLLDRHQGEQKKNQKNPKRGIKQFVKK